MQLLRCQDEGKRKDPRRNAEMALPQMRGIGCPEARQRHEAARGVPQAAAASSPPTLDQYAHAIPANNCTAADLMGAIYNALAEPSARIVELDRKTA